MTVRCWARSGSGSGRTGLLASPARGRPRPTTARWPGPIATSRPPGSRPRVEQAPCETRRDEPSYPHPPVRVEYQQSTCTGLSPITKPRTRAGSRRPSSCTRSFRRSLSSHSTPAAIVSGVDTFRRSPPANSWPTNPRSVRPRGGPRRSRAARPRFGSKGTSPVENSQKPPASSVALHPDPFPGRRRHSFSQPRTRNLPCLSSLQRNPQRAVKSPPGRPAAASRSVEAPDRKPEMARQSPAKSPAARRVIPSRRPGQLAQRPRPRLGIRPRSPARCYRLGRTCSSSVGACRPGSSLHAYRPAEYFHELPGSHDFGSMLSLPLPVPRNSVVGCRAGTKGGQDTEGVEIGLDRR